MLMTTLFGAISVLHVSLVLEHGWPLVLEGAMGAASVSIEGVGAMGVAGTVGLLLTGGEVSAKLDGTFRCLLKSVISVVKILGLPVEIMMVSMLFEVNTFELIDLLFLYFVVPCVLLCC